MRAPLLCVLAASAAALRAPVLRAPARRACVSCRFDFDDDENRPLADNWEATGRADDLAAEVAKFRAQADAEAAIRGDDAETVTFLDQTINTLGTILTYNFFIIITFFAWFMTGVIGQFGFQSFGLINAFRGCWDVLIMPLLTTHMTLTFLSWGLEKVAGNAEA